MTPVVSLIRGHSSNFLKLICRPFNWRGDWFIDKKNCVFGYGFNSANFVFESVCKEIYLCNFYDSKLVVVVMHHLPDGLVLKACVRVNWLFSFPSKSFGTNCMYFAFVGSFISPSSSWLSISMGFIDIDNNLLVYW